MEDSSQDVKKTDNPFIVFFVGLTAGYIATILPRLITYLSVSEESVELSFFSGEYFLASSLFAIVIGISMVWLNYGKKETTNNLFMTALALPSVISGAINMSSTTVSGEASLKELEFQYQMVESALHEVSGLSDVPVVDFEVSSLEDVSVDARGYLPFISSAYAAENSDNKDAADSLGSANSLGMGIKFNLRTQQKNYIVILDQSKDLELIKSRLESYSQVLLIPNLKLKRAKSMYYIVQDIPRSKSFAYIEVLRLNKNYGLQASLAKLK